MQFNPNVESEYRAQSENYARTAGITLNRRYCHKCGKSKNTTDGKIIRGASRHNPSVFLCAECK